jgi:hypothetical protein
MIISETYGPQFDATDGTVGKTQLVKRWAVVKADGFMLGASQGRNTHATKEEADSYLAAVMANNSAETLKQYLPLTVAPFWCWPTHFDPVGSA